MTNVFGRDAEVRNFWRLLNRYSGGVLGYYGMSGIGKSTLLSRFEQELHQTPFTPYIARLDFADSSLHHPVAALVNLIQQLEATGATTKQEGWFKRKRSESPLIPALQALNSTQVIVNQKIDIRSSNSKLSQVTNQAPVQVANVSQAQINDAIGKLKIGISKLHIMPTTPPNFTSLRRPLVIVFADTLELAPEPVIDWLKQIGSSTFQEYLLLVAAGQERIDSLLTHSLEFIGDTAAYELLGTRFGLFDRQQTEPIVKLARGIPRCLCLAGEYVQQISLSGLQKAVPEGISGHLVADYLVRGILKRLPESSTEKHLLAYGCVLRRWNSTEQLRIILFNVPEIRALIGESADIRGAIDRLRERSFLDSGHPHATLRDLLLYDLEHEEPSIVNALHRSAANWFVHKQENGNAIHHLLVLEDWSAIKQIWRSMLDQQSKQNVRALIDEVLQKNIPPEPDIQLLLVESGLLLEDKVLVRPILTLLNTQLGDQRPIVESLANRIINASFAPDLLQLSLKVNLSFDALQKADALVRLAELLRIQNNFPAATEQYETALDLYIETNNGLGEAKVLHGLGNVFQFQSRYEEATGYFFEALEMHKKIDDDLGKAIILYDLGEVLRLRSQYSESTECFKGSLTLYTKLGNGLGRANSLLGLGEVMLLRSQYAEAKEYAEEALTLYTKLEGRVGRANCLYTLGDILKVQYQYAVATERYNEALIIFTEIDNSLGKANTLLRLGLLFQLQSRYVAATERYNEALIIYTEIGSRQGKASVLNGLGGVLRSQAKYAEAKESYKEALIIHTEIGSRQGKANALRGLGNVLQSQSQYVEAEESYKAALEIYYEIGNQLEIAYSLRDLADVMADSGDFCEGLDFLNQLESHLADSTNWETNRIFSALSFESLRPKLEAGCLKAKYPSS
ncbi:MAG: tetratricopeptide repeat protein [Chloroflexi bacterium]|nr:tetratricopeptide repeat protein [Chloroflexota bacterium]MCC6897210.1 tetratricopeptide repeat protein [Anaerolineae bacterium]